MNNVNLIGRVVRDVELRKVGETSVANFTLVVNNRRKVKDSYVDQPLYLDCEAWDTGAEFLAKSTAKGTKLAVVGSLKQDEWEKDNQKFRKIKLRVGSFDVLTWQNDGQESAGGETNVAGPATDADIPF